jgi:hypothetical protein
LYLCHLTLERERMNTEAFFGQIINVLEDIRQELSLIRERLPVSKTEESGRVLLNEDTELDRPERRKFPR